MPSFSQQYLALKLPKLQAEGDRILAGDYIFLGVPTRERPLDWHRDPLTGVEAPRRFALDIDYRDPAICGSARTIWEKSRHHHLTLLGVLFATTRGERYALEVETQLHSWVRANPFPLGINWTSSLELGIRLLSWVWLDRLLRGSDVHARLFGPDGLLWPVIYRHQWMIRAHRSYGSSANNHLLGEMAGLYVSAGQWQVFPESPAWRRYAWRVLKREISRQFNEDGLNREQAFAYHIFALEFVLIAALEAQRWGEPFPLHAERRIRAAIEAIPQLMDTAGGVPRYGDSDDGLAIQLQERAASRTDWLAQLGGCAFGAPTLSRDEASEAIAARLLRSGVPEQHSHRVTKDHRSFPDSGVYVLASDRRTRDEVFILVDAGPMGFPSMAAHGHADALSFTLSAGGRPIVIDPGTYAYHSDPAARDYFRSTAAHNTVRVADLEQAESAGPFMWKRQVRTRVLRWEPAADGGFLEAEHDGYLRLPGRVLHRRRFELRNRRLAMRDAIVGTGTHRIEWRLHFAPDAEVDLKSSAVIRSGNRWVRVELDPQLTYRTVRGQPEGGWYSPSFNLREPTTTLIGVAELGLPVQLQTVVEVIG